MNEESNYVNRYKPCVGRNYYYGGGLFVSTESCKNYHERKSNHDFDRKPITEFSPSSARRMRKYLRECDAEYKHMVTLTYPFCYPSNGIEVKEHLRRFIQELRRYAKRNKQFNKSWSVFWFLEFQNRGAPHFHLFTTSRTPKEFVSKRWYEIVKSEDERHHRAGTKCETLRAGRNGASSYASKYATKNIQKIVPDGYENVGRFWGIQGLRSVVSAATWVSSQAMEVPAVQSSVNNIKQAIKRGLADGNCKKLPTKNGTAIAIVFTSNEHHYKMLQRVLLLEVCLRVNNVNRSEVREDLDLIIGGDG